MSCTYKVSQNEIYDEDGKAHTVYGIEAWSSDTCVKSVTDIFFDRQKAENMAALCNRLEVSSVHLTDVAEDALA